MPDFLKVEGNKEFKDAAESTFWQWVKKEIDGEYDDNINAKTLRASTFPKTKGGVVEFNRDRLYVKDKLVLNLA